MLGAVPLCTTLSSAHWYLITVIRVSLYPESAWVYPYIDQMTEADQKPVSRTQSDGNIVGELN